MELARQRCSDEKAPVRKSAVQLLEQLLLLQAPPSNLPSDGKALGPKLFPTQRV